MKYEKKITLGRDKDGKLIRKSIYGNTKAEIEKKAFRARQEWLETASKVTKDDISFIAFTHRWYQNEKANKGSYTQAFYRSVIKQYLEPNFSDLYFDEITLADFQNVINSVFHQPYTCRQIKSTLIQIYSAAYDDDLISGKMPNFKRLVLPPKPKSTTRALTDNEKQAILNADFTDREKAFVFILYYTGMRKEEALALEPSCFDFKNKTISVRQTVTYIKGNTLIEKKAKNLYSIRTINLPDVCVPFLRDYVASCKKWLFPSSKNEDQVITSGSFNFFWKNIRKKIEAIAPEAETLHPHLFRHNYATMLYYSNVTPKMAAKLLGHSDTSMIMKVYAHLDEQKEQVTDKLNAIFTT